MEPLVIRHHIAKEREGTYYTLPFSVPPGVETLTVAYTYAQKGGGVLKDLRPSNTVDLGLCNEQGTFLGWSGSAHREISVGPHRSSPGYLTCPVRPGQWQILIGAYHIEPQGVDVTYTVTFQQAQARWYFGDLHMHSTASDGAFSPWELGARARKLGLDFVGVADHNNYAENLHLPFVPGITFVPAVEWTHYKGHMNVFGVEAPFENSFVANTKEEMRRLIEQARAMGATVSVNHPKCPFCPYLWEDDDAFDLMEIWNGPFRPANVRAIRWWTELLKQGRRIPIVGGSDYHRPGVVRLGHPVTAVYAPSPAAQDLLDAIRKGRAFVSESVRGPRIELQYGDVPMGGTAAFDEGTLLTVRCSEKKVVLVTDSGEFSVTVPQGEAAVPLPNPRFVYAKVPGIFPGRLRAVSNPIYFEQKAVC